MSRVFVSDERVCVAGICGAKWCSEVSSGCTVDVLVLVWDLFPLNLWANGD